MSIWDGFRKGIKHNLDEGKEIAVDGLVNVGNRVADLIGVPEEPEAEEETQTFDYILYAAGGITLVALALVVFFKFSR
jgi:hypothetical protein